MVDMAKSAVGRGQGKIAQIEDEIKFNA